MATNKKPRKRYRPKPINCNTIGFAMESVATLSSMHSDYLLNLKIKNSEAMVALMRGTATKADMDTLIAMSNIVEALHSMGFGKEYQDVCVEGRYAILSVIYRAVDKLKFVLTASEIKALNTLMELHDAQFEVITVRDVEKALQIAKRKIRQNDAIKLPKLPEELRT